jgi:hypothetical protein
MSVVPKLGQWGYLGGFGRRLLEALFFPLIYDWSDFKPGIAKLASLHEVRSSHSEFTNSERVTKCDVLLASSSLVGYANRCSEEWGRGTGHNFMEPRRRWNHICRLFGRKRSWSSGSTLLVFVWRDWGKPWESWVSLFDVPTEIRGENVSNTALPLR